MFNKSYFNKHYFVASYFPLGAIRTVRGIVWKAKYSNVAEFSARLQ